jgi:hypothetical protein
MSDWKNVHANAAGKALDHDLVKDVIAEYAENMGFDPENGLPAYGVRKVAMYAAQVARAQALGFDPNLLRMTDEETNSDLLALAAEAVLRGLPTWVLDGSGGAS